MVRDDNHGQDRGGDHVEPLGDHHNPLLTKPVRHDAAHKGKDEERPHERKEYEGQVHRRAGQGDNKPAPRHLLHLHGEHSRQVAEPE